MSNQPTDTPKVIAFPPLVFLTGLGLGLGLHWMLPVQPFPQAICNELATALYLTSAVIGFWAAIVMWRAGTPLRPRRPVTALVTSGPFRFSRNPLYLTMTLLYAGIALHVNALWPMLTLVPTVIFVQRRIIRLEEQCLEAKFGETYRAYRARVRRWI